MADQKFGKIWFLPYHTGKDFSQIHPTGYVWYDELVVSRQKNQESRTQSGEIEMPISQDVKLGRRVQIHH